MSEEPSQEEFIRLTYEAYDSATQVLAFLSRLCTDLTRLAAMQDVPDLRVVGQAQRAAAIAEHFGLHFLRIRAQLEGHYVSDER